MGLHLTSDEKGARGSERTTTLTMKLLLEGLLVALVLMCALVSVAALGRHTVATETHPPAAGSFTIVASDDRGGAYRWVEWDGSSSSSCSGVVWEVQRADPSSSESEAGGIIGEAKEDCRGVHIRPHLATSRQPSARPTTGGHRAHPTSEYPSSEGAPRGRKLPLRKEVKR
jgi:hypothetical protein